MLILAILAFLQMTAIPGVIIVCYSGLKLHGKLQTALYIFGFSILSNYLIVFALTAMGIYQPLTIYGLIILEICALLFWIKKRKLNYISFSIQHALFSVKDFFNSVSIGYRILLILSFGAIGLFLYFAISRITAIFYLNDSILAWNRFALDFYHNRLPLQTWRYPQIIPTNWSIAYIIMQNPDLQFVPRNMMIFFPIGTLLIFLDLAIKKKESAYLGGVLIYTAMLNYLYRPDFITDGYADIAVSFFAFLAFYVLYSYIGTASHALMFEGIPFLRKNSLDPSPNNKTLTNYKKKGTMSHSIQNLLLSVIFASAASVTKQIGLYILLFILGWNLLLIYQNKCNLSKKEIIKILILIVLIVIVIVATWYVYKEIRIMKGLEISELTMLTQSQHLGRNYAQRLNFAIQSIIQAGNIPHAGYALLAVLIFIIISLYHQKMRYIVLFIIFPFLLIWMFLFSYDYRNLMLALPFMALSVSYGVSIVYEWIFTIKQPVTARQEKSESIVRRDFHVFKFPLLIFLLIIAVLIMTLNYTVLSRERLINNQQAQLRNIGDARFNAKLYRYFEANGISGKVFSRYYYFRYLPLLRNYWTPERTHPEIRYLIEAFNRPNRLIIKDIKSKLRSGEYREVMKHNEFLLLKKQVPK